LFQRLPPLSAKLVKGKKVIADGAVLHDISGLDRVGVACGGDDPVGGLAVRVASQTPLKA